MSYIKKIYLKVLSIIALFVRIFYWIKKEFRKKLHEKDFHKLEKYKNRYCGERIFLIGTGPSLTEEDINKVRNEYTFSVNSFVLAMKELNFEPSFYGFIDGDNMDLYGDEILALSDSDIFYTCKYPLKRKYKRQLRKKTNAYEFLQMDNRFWEGLAKDVPVGFSTDITDEVYWGYTCMYSMMQIIAYMGFSKVYLMGMDCIYAPGVRDFYDCRDEKTIAEGSYGGGTVPGFIKAWESVEKFTREMNIKIYNATRGGMLEVFERVDLDSIL